MSLKVIEELAAGARKAVKGSSRKTRRRRDRNAERADWRLILNNRTLSPDLRRLDYRPQRGTQSTALGILIIEGQGDFLKK